jgi:HD-GYP domain-containing protein (c-di-GMP phosphodiesterase class II)
MKTYNLELLKQVEDIINIGIALSAEKDQNHLLEMIVTEARKITRADAGTLYLREGDYLIFKIIYNSTLNYYKGGKNEAINLPPAPLVIDNVSSYAALTKTVVNIPDVYKAKEFDFSETIKYDLITGYHTASMLVIPLENHTGEVIGVLQLINSQDERGNVVPFDTHYEKVISSLASQAAISLTNKQLMLDIEKLFNSFVEVMATAIDSRTPYNANHTRRVALLAGELARVIGESTEGIWANEVFSEERITQLVMAGWLHDVGKIATPLSVMNKATRLAERIELVLQRLDYILLNLKAKYLDKKLSLYIVGKENELHDLEEEWCEQQVQLEDAREFIIKVNNPATLVNKEVLNKLTKIAALTYTDPNGREYPWLYDSELTALSVVKGTLTKKERGIMEDHVIITQRMLNKIPFTGNLKQVPYFASIHHEHLNGNGYPLGLQGDDIPLEGRILALVDVFDALTAFDRPYKKEMPLEQALKTLECMVKDGELDGDLLDIFRRSKVWERVKD